jgi:hypothetical protein
MEVLMHAPKPSIVHPFENSPLLPVSVRGYHFVHNHHISAAMGLPIPDPQGLQEVLGHLEDFINPFTIRTKGSLPRIREIVQSDPLLSGRTYRQAQPPVQEWLAAYTTNSATLMYGNGPDSGYPVNELLLGYAYVLAGEAGEGLRGNRIAGNFIELIKRFLVSSPAITLRLPDLLTPLIIEGTSSAALIGPKNPGVYKRLITKDGPYLYKVRAITEEDLSASR